MKLARTFRGIFQLQHHRDLEKMVMNGQQNTLNNCETSRQKYNQHSFRSTTLGCEAHISFNNGHIVVIWIKRRGFCIRRGYTTMFVQSAWMFVNASILRIWRIPAAKSKVKSAQIPLWILPWPEVDTVVGCRKWNLIYIVISAPI